MLGALFAVLAVWGTARVVLDADGPWSAHPPVALGPVSEQADLRQVFDSLPPTGGEQARVRLLADNTEAWVARWRLLARAEQRIDVSYFILKQDVFGAAFLGHLLHKARQGVQVRILLDAMGSKMSRRPRGNDYLDALVNAENVEVKLYRPLARRYLDALLLLNPAAIWASDHDKILVVDDELALIGGRNISREYFAHPNDFVRAFHDADLLVQDARAVRALVHAFASEYLSDKARPVRRERLDLVRSEHDVELAYRAMSAWLDGQPVGEDLAAAMRASRLDWDLALARQPHLRGAVREAGSPGVRAPLRVVDSPARLLAPGDPISRALVRLAGAARKDLLIQSPYLVLSDEAVDVLAAAGERGVAITVLTNSPVSSDNALSQAFFLEQWPRLLARVPNLRIFVAGDTHNLHSKLAVIDGAVSLVGTYNLDPLSMALNSEIMAVVWSQEFATQVAAKSRTRIAAGAPDVYEYRIARDSQGKARLDGGRPRIVFGPWDHADPDASSASLAFYSMLLRGAAVIPGLSPFL